jgi:hypothetical protein
VTPLQFWATFRGIDVFGHGRFLTENNHPRPIARVSPISITTRDGLGLGVRP